jgi:hypothetical protein
MALRKLLAAFLGISAAVQSFRAGAAGGDGLPGSFVRPGGGPADPIVYDVEGWATGHRGLPGHFGHRLARIDDIDGDGVAEFAASARSFPVAERQAGFVGLFSGRSGARLRHWLAPEGRDYYGEALGVSGDVDGDGIRELVIMDGYGGFDVLSPVTGRVFFEVPRPRGRVQGLTAIVSLGDVDGNGVGDVALAVGGYNDVPDPAGQGGFSVGRVAAHSGADGRLLWERSGEEDSLFGLSAVATGDVSGDGVPDLVVSEPFSGPEGARPVQSPASRLHVLSGADGVTLATHAGEPWQLLLGRNMAFIGDTDGNGRVEVVAAAPWTHNGFREEAGWAGVFELPGFDLRYEVWGEHGGDFNFAPDYLGFHTSSAGDADGDGADDFLLSTYHARTLSVDRVWGRFYLHSGRTGDLLQVYEALHSPTGATPEAPYVSALSPLGDVDGDGRAEFLVGAGGGAEDGALRGYVHLVRYQPELEPFRRGDIDGDGRGTITDIVRVARGILTPAPLEPCLAAYDVNGDSRLDANDVLDLVCHVFYCYGFIPPEPATPGLGCGRHARLKPGPREIPFGCEAHPCGG